MWGDSDPKGDDWLERVRTIAPLIAQERDAGERERRLPRPLFEALRDAGLLRLSTPSAVGKLELPESTIVRVLEALSREDGSVGWNAMVASNTATIASYLPPDGIRQVFADPTAVVAGALLPKGQAVAVPGGYRLSGRWTMASGCHQASWMVAASIVTDGTSMRPREDGRPDIRTFFVPASACSLIETWQTTGLRGTGSDDWEVHDLFVPETLSFPVLLEGKRVPGALYVLDFASYAVARIAAVALGIARDAIGSFVITAHGKVPTAGASSLAQLHTTHAAVGRAEALVRGARAYLDATVRALPYTPTWSVPLDDEERSSIRLAAAHATEQAVEAVDSLFRLAGTSGIYAHSRLDRCFRDIHVVAQHINVAPFNVEMVGQYLLGFGLAIRR